MTTDTKYPILLVHGMSFRDFKRICYWGRIPKILKKCGSDVYFGEQDGNGSIVGNAKQIAINLDKILLETGAEKVNIIAHSKGGLEARYLISSMGYGDKIGTLTTISTPHNGSETVDKLLKLPRFLVKFGCGIINLWFRILGDKSPDTYGAINGFQTSNSEKFNRENPDDDRVYYQSYSFVMKKPTADMTMFIPWLVVNGIEGESDGLLTPKNTRWSNFKGVYSGKGRGISHCDEVDMRRYKLKVFSEDNEFDDITLLYCNIVQELKEMGY